MRMAANGAVWFKCTRILRRRIHRDLEVFGSVVADSGGVLKFSVGWVILAVSEWIVRL